MQRTLDPPGETFGIPAADHGVEVGNGLAGLDESRDAAFDGGDDYRFGFRQGVSADRHEPRDGAGRGHARQRLGIRLLGSTPAGRPLANDAQGPAEAMVLELAPETGRVPSSAVPLRVQPGQV